MNASRTARASRAAVTSRMTRIVPPSPPMSSPPTTGKADTSIQRRLLDVVDGHRAHRPAELDAHRPASRSPMVAAGGPDKGAQDARAGRRRRRRPRSASAAGLDSTIEPSPSHTTTASPMLSMTRLELRRARLLGDGQRTQALLVVLPLARRGEHVGDGLQEVARRPRRRHASLACACRARRTGLPVLPMTTVRPLTTPWSVEQSRRREARLRAQVLDHDRAHRREGVAALRAAGRP